MAFYVYSAAVAGAIIATALVSGGAQAQEGQLIYVPNVFTGNFSSIDTASDSLVADNVSIGMNLNAAAVSPDQSRAYISDVANHSVFVVDTATNAVIGTIGVGLNPEKIVISPDGSRLYTSNIGDDTLSIIDTATNFVVATIATGGSGPLELSVSPNGAFVYVAHATGNSIIKVDTASNSIVTTFSLPSGIAGVYASPDDAKLYVAEIGTTNLHVLNSSTGAILKTLSIGGAGSALTSSPDGSRLFVANFASGSVSVIDLATDTVVTTFAVGTSPQGLVVSADGGKLYVANRGSNTVQIFSIDAATDTYTLINTIARSGPRFISACSNGNTLLTSGRVFTANSSGALLCTTTTPTGQAAGPIFDGGTMLINGPAVNSSLPIFLMAGGGIVDTQAHTATFSGAIDGPGSFAKIGTGTLILSGTNTYTGGTTVTGGTLQAGAAGAFVNNTAYTVNGGTLDMNGFGLTMSSLSGTGGLVTMGAADLIVDQASDTEFAGALTGAGSLSKTGVGTLTLNGVNTYTGLTTVDGGKLVVGDASHPGAVIAGGVSVMSGATMGGSGTVGTTTIASGGTIAPGNSIGTLNVAGDYTQKAGSTYVAEIDPAGNSDLINVTGKATIEGGTVFAFKAPGGYSAGTRYTILTAGGGVIGSYDALGENAPFVNLALAYDPANVYLDIARNTASFPSVGATPNQKAAAAGAESLGSANTLYDAVVGQTSADDARTAFDALSGEIHASAKSALIEDSRFVRDAFSARIRAAFEGVGAVASPVLAYGPDGQELVPAATESAGAWGSVFGSWGSTDGDGNAAGLNRSTGGFVTGLDGLVAENWRLGIMTGYSHSSFDADDRASTGSSDTYHIGLYGGTQWGSLGLRSGLAYSWHDIDTARSVVFPGFADNLTANYDAGTFQAFGEAGYRIDTASASFEPFANLAYVNLHTSGFAETGGAAALTSADQSTEATFTTLGLRASTNFAVGTINATARGMLGWKHAFGDIAPLATHAFAGSDAFTIAGAPIARNAAVIEAGLDFDITPMAKFGVSYNGEIASKARNHGFKADLSVRF